MLDSTSSLVITRIKPSEDGNLIVRVFNPTKKSASTNLITKSIDRTEFYLSNGDEEEIEQINNRITLDPFELVTLKLRTK